MLDNFCITPGRYACTGCAFDQPWPFPPKRPVYRLDDGTTAYGFAARGWCAACRCVRQIESFDLECGSEDTREFAFDQESGIDTNFEHACGGHLKIVGPDADTPRFYVSIHEALLTPEGELVERDDD